MTGGYFLGVDGGGSKTAYVVLDGDGRTVAEMAGPSCYYFAAGIELLERVLSAGLAGVTAAAGITPAELDHAFFGLPGFGEISADMPLVREIVRRLLGHDRFTVDNDMVGGWAGAFAGQDGINVVAGTGSIAYGERRGVAHRAGGWSELFGDEGSAYWVAVQGLNAFSRMSDGRTPRGPLHALIAAKVGITSDLDLVGTVVDRWAGQRAVVARLSVTVVEAADAGDAAALAILERAGVELVELISACRSSLGYREGEPVAVSYSGGMFSAPAFRAAFTRALQAAGPEFELRTPIHGPAVGSALCAMKAHGAALPPLPAPGA
ncbi:N-acetylglucosamine kinase [Actinospica robiniae]|uniref:N-acetylglucosamine kinase n=1 Tax=Actinospica robiniae TaxID=304901 RepID=UPI0003FD7809|nr:BadF/BadG/BcrA/BcrD ATPase family protein [Actinospica robiniae]